MTPENFAKIQADLEKVKIENSNKEIAMQEERKKRKEAQALLDSKSNETNKELEQFRKEKKEREEKKQKEKGKYEELLATKQKELDEATKRAELYNTYESTKLAELEVKLENVPEDKRETVKKLLDKTESLKEKGDIISMFIVKEDKDTF